MQLRETTSDFKLVVNTIILEKAGAGLHTVSSCFWDSASDGSTVVRWESDTLIAIVTVYGIKLD